MSESSSIEPADISESASQVRASTSHPYLKHGAENSKKTGQGGLKSRQIIEKESDGNFLGSITSA